MMNQDRGCVLLTGFEPFGGEAINPSEGVSRALEGAIIAGTRIVARVLPCVFREASTVLIDSVETLRPRAVICLGQAGGRNGITVERVAINIDDARLPDNRGGRPIDEPIVADGPVGYWSTLPIKAIVEDLRKAGVVASVSQTAGTFVCNHVFYSLMHHVSTRSSVNLVSAGFVHLPWLPEQVRTRPGEPSLALEDQVAAVRRLIETALTSGERRLEGGAEQ
ncbi:MAG: pyroglutamyl-peptidase I [Opitutaceae bacterium]